MPFIVRWPGKLEAGRIDTENVTSFIDWMPTLATIAGVENLPEEMDGEDISDIWMGANRERGEPLFWRVSSPRAAPVMREGKWKLHFKDLNGNKVELYDLVKDPSESTNLAMQEQEITEKMSVQLKTWLAELPKDYEKKR